MGTSERLVLTLDGSTRVCGAALLRPRPARERSGPDPASWEVVARRSDLDGRGQAKILLRLVDEMLWESGNSPQDLGAIVVGTGPGTFTGVRITVATGRALSLALGRPVLGVSTLAALAATASARAGLPDLIVPVVDARRGQVFFGLYAALGGSESERGGGTGRGAGDHHGQRYGRSAAYGVCDREALGDIISGGALAAGGRALVVAEERGLIGDLPPAAVFAEAFVDPERLVEGQDMLEEPGRRPEGWRLTPWLLKSLDVTAPAESGSTVMALGHPGDTGTPEAVTPIYVRSPDADIHITKMRDPWADARSGRDVEGNG